MAATKILRRMTVPDAVTDELTDDEKVSAIAARPTTKTHARISYPDCCRN
jgi:hypothetical protein